MNRSDFNALVQGALDHTLTPGEQARLTRILTESAAARDRASELDQLVALLDSLGPADVPPGLDTNVQAEISHRPPVVRPSTFSRGITVNKKILFGLAAAAVIVLAVITYNTYPPVTIGTEATIGAAQRAQTPQIAAQDVKLGDTSSQDLLQTATFDAIMKDDTVRTMLQDAHLREQLRDAGLRDALQDEAMRAALRDPALAAHLQDQAFLRSLNDPGLMKQFNDANMRVMLANKAFVDALRSPQFRSLLSRNGVAAALAGAAFQSALRDGGFAAAMRSQSFASSLAAR